PAAGREHERGGARAGVMRVYLEGPAVTVVMAADRAVLLLVGRLGNAGRGRRARDVGDPVDMVPVDPVPDPEGQSGREDSDPRRERGGREQQVEQDRVVLSPGS